MADGDALVADTADEAASVPAQPRAGSLAAFRQKYPDYDDMSDQDLADRLHTKFYSDLEKPDFYKRIGFEPTPSRRKQPNTYLEREADRFGDNMEGVKAAARGFARGAEEGFGPEPLMSSPDAEWLKSFGLQMPKGVDPSNYPIRQTLNTTAREIGVPVSLFMRAFNAGVHGVAGAAGEVIREAGGSETQAAAADREVVNLGNFLMTRVPEGAHAVARRPGAEKAVEGQERVPPPDVPTDPRDGPPPPGAGAAPATEMPQVRPGEWDISTATFKEPDAAVNTFDRFDPAASKSDVPGEMHPVDQAAAKVNTEPTDAQKEAGNYAKGHVNVQGLDVAIETPKDAVRRGTGPEGPWENTSPAHYGYIKRTKGGDGEHIDTYIGQHPDSDRVFVVDQIDPKTGKFDEHKVVLGARSADEAVGIYDGGFSDGSGPARRSAVTPLSMGEFKDWLENGNTKKPMDAGVARARNVAREERLTEPADINYFIAQNGGIRDATGELRAMGIRQIMTPSGPLIRKNGMHPDRARELAQQHGYLPGEDPNAPAAVDTSHLFDAMERSQNQDRVYSEHDRSDVDAWRGQRDQIARTDALNRALKDSNLHGDRFSPTELKAAEDLVAQGRDAADAIAEVVERRAMEVEAHYAQPGGTGPVGKEPSRAREATEGRRAERGDEGGGEPSEAEVPFSRRGPADDVTDQGVQRVIEGAERVEPEVARETLRDRQRKFEAERLRAVKERETKLRRGNQQSVRDQEGGLFSGERDQGTLPNLDPKKQGSLFERRGPGGDPALREARQNLRVKRGAEAMIDRLRLQAGLDEAKVRRSQRGERVNVKQPPERADIRAIEEFVNWIGHDLLRGKGLRFREGTESGAMGMYNHAARVVTIFRRAITEGTLPHTAIHEIWHSVEENLPRRDRERVYQEYGRQQEKWLRKNEWARPFRDDIGEMRNGLVGPEAADWLRRFGDMDRLNERVKTDKVGNDVRVRINWTDENYRYKNPSEYFAETMTDKHFNMSELRDHMARSVVGHLRNVYQRIVNGIKRVFGRDATGRIYEGFGRGEYAPNRGYGMPLSAGEVHMAAGVPGAGGRPPRGPGAIARTIARAGHMVPPRVVEAFTEFGRDLQMLATPMAAGSKRAMATAKDFANHMRVAMHDWGKIDERIAKQFDPQARERMWNALDEESVAAQTGGRPAAGTGFARLNPEELATVQQLSQIAQATYARAKALGMVKDDGLPHYTPRMVVEAANGARPKAGDTVKVVRDIRTLPLAIAKLQQAIIGKELINSIKAMSHQTGRGLASSGQGSPAGGIGANLRTTTPNLIKRKYLTTAETEAAANRKFQNATPRDETFTMDHPAFREWQPEMIKDPATGKFRPRLDENGDIVFKPVSIHVPKEFEGPLRAVLSNKAGLFYRGLMGVKARAMTMIMYSPLIHNAVEYGRALPAMPGKVFTFKIYSEGNRARNDPAVMREAIAAGVVPIGQRFAWQDITSITQDANIAPGRSWTAQALALPARAFGKSAADFVKRSVDTAGDIWHKKLLWDQVAKLQMGLYVNFRDNLIKHGTDPRSAQRVAAHFANRYAGALPMEAMSNGARKLANLTLFSRSFTLGNLGVMKDAMNGLPRDVRAQIQRDGGVVAMSQIKSMARRKAISVIMMDAGLLYVTNSILQSLFNMLAQDSSLDEEAQGYVRRAKDLLGRVKENPLVLLSPEKGLPSIASTADNEPGKQERVLVGYDKDGTGIYMRNPVGKIGEEFTNWPTAPIDMLKRKLSTFARPFLQMMSNDKGFGQKLYDPHANTLGGWAKNAGNIIEAFVGSQVPVQQIKAARDIVTGDGDWRVNAAQVAGPIAGLTFSHGAPGGPEVGVVYRTRQEHEYKVQQAMPDIRRQIKRGEVGEARAKMRELGISPAMQNFYVRSTLNPKTRLSGRALQDFMRYATPEEKERLSRARDRRASAEP